MNLSKVERVQLDMSNDEAYALWCVLDEVHDANEVALPEAIVILTAELRKMMDYRPTKPRETFRDSRERIMQEAAEKQDVGIKPDPRGAMTGR